MVLFLDSGGALPEGGLYTVGDYNQTDKMGWGFLLRALNTHSDTNILSTPSVITLDNEEAKIVVGSEVPFVTGQYTQNGDSVTNPFQTIERKDVGIKLTVTPQINSGDSIQMKIVQEVSNVEGSSVGSELVTSNRTLETHVLVKDGSILALGGVDG